MSDKSPIGESTAPAGAGRQPGPEMKTDSLLGEMDLHLFNEGTHARLYHRLGAHPLRSAGRDGTFFAVWAPNAERVSVIGEFNGWRRDENPLTLRGSSGIWEGFIPGVRTGSQYKYHIASRLQGYRVDKADPFAFRAQLPPDTASIVWDLDYQWSDQEWMRERAARNALDAPISIYELHLGSWMRVPEEGDRMLTYREAAPLIAGYCERMGFTHVEFLPLTEHPFYGSWGYQVSGFFAPTSRYGTPQDLMYLIDHLHQRGIGVLLDWVPGHFPTDEHGLGYFDGTHLFEHADPRQGFHPDWKSSIFNYGRNDVQSFLISSAMYWLDLYHIDGLRVDGVASMLYLDYSRKEGEWIPNVHGGNENLEAIAFLRRLNQVLYENFPDTQTIAEESTSWPMVSRPIYLGGLGFGLKWDMGWMHDTLAYLQRDPIHRRYHHDQLTFRAMYAGHENFCLPLSHDEVVHGKGSLLDSMVGDVWQKLANLRLLFAYQTATPGKKLNFMGSEFGQWEEWNHDRSLQWHLAEQPEHAGLQRALADLNALYREWPAMHRHDCQPDLGFEWIEANDSDHSVLCTLRKAEDEASVICVFNFTPEPRIGYRVGVDEPGFYRELLNTDASEYGGSGLGNGGGLQADAELGAHGRACSLLATVPPLAAVFFAREED